MQPISPVAHIEDPFLIIAGATKAGTTSLFKYLAAHPDISPCKVKDPFFFLPVAFPRDSPLRYTRDSLSSYLALFPEGGSNKTRMEASPLYLQSPEAAENIHEALPNARIVVSLREPVSRLLSYYKMAVLFNWLPPNLTFDQYVDEAFDAKDKLSASPYYKYPIDEGLYTKRIKRCISLFGDSCFYTIWFDDLQRSPRNTLKQIAEFSKIDPAFYETYNFENVNPSRSSRNPQITSAFFRLKHTIRQKLRTTSRTRKILAYLNRKLEPSFIDLMIQESGSIHMQPKTLKRLKEFYWEDVHSLNSVLNCTAPWTNQYR